VGYQNGQKLLSNFCPKIKKLVFYKKHTRSVAKMKPKENQGG